MATILLVNDSQETASFLRTLLEREGYLVALTDNARGAAEMARSILPDLLLIDLAIRSYPAWKSIRELKADPHLSAIPVIAVTRATMGAAHERALAAGCDGFVAEPIDPEAMKRLVAASLEKGTADEDTLTRPLAITTPSLREGGRARILLASPDAGLLQSCGSALRLRRYQVVSAASAADTLREIESGPPDLVLLDAAPAEGFSAELATQIRSRWRGRFLPTLFLLEAGAKAPPGAETLAEDYVFKPVDPVLLSTRIRRLLLLGRALRAEKQRARELAVVARQMALGIILFDEEGRITLMNRQAADLLGLPANSLQGRSARHLFRVAGLEDATGRPVDAEENPVARLLRSRTAFLRETYQRRRDSGEILRIEATFAGILQGRKSLQGTSMVLRRAAARSQDQRELQEAYERLMEADQLKSKFLSMVSHELRTPLNTIILLSHLLTTEPEGARSGERVRHDLEIIRQSGTTLLHMINNLLDLAKLEAGQSEISPESFALRSFLEETIEILRPQAENKGLKLELRCDSGVEEFVTLDREKVRQVLINLLSNALKFTSQGQVVLEAAGNPGRTALLFTVRDTGIGIPPEKLSLIFEPFRQVASSEPSGKGSGLGLSIVRELVHLMGGEVTVDTSPGRGSAFRFSLPYARPRATPVEQEITHPLPTRPRGPRRILVVEDDAHSRYGLKSVLQMEGYEVDEAATAGQARRMLAEARHDAVFMDISLPDADGAQLIREIRRGSRNPDVPIIALTGKTSDEDRGRIREAGATSYLTKPVDVKILLRTLEKLTVRSLPREKSVR